MTALVTGATGRIGRVLVERLVGEGESVRALVRPTSDTAALDALGVDLVEAPLTDAEALARAADGCDVVYHLAVSRDAQAPPTRNAHYVNADGTDALARAAATAGVGRFVFASTLGVYGLVTDGVVDEERPARPNTAYRRSKLDGEVALRRIETEADLPVTIARISKVVGAGAVRWAGFYGVVADGTLRLVGNGANRIQPAHNTDIADGLIRCATVPEAAGETYILAGAEPVTLRAFADLVADALGVPPPPPGPPSILHRTYLELEDLLFRTMGRTLPGAHERELFVLNRVSSIEKARRELGYAPQWSIEASVEQMAEDFRARGLLAT